MERYCVNTNAQPNGDNEVHKEGCAFLPLLRNRFDLGFHLNCQTAVIQARLMYPRANGCMFCSLPCHTS